MRRTKESKRCRGDPNQDLSAYELAELADDERERARLMTFVLVGGGPTGVELAASMAHMATVTLRRNFRHIDPAKSSIVLIEGGNRILPTFAEILVSESRQAARETRGQGSHGKDRLNELTSKASSPEERVFPARRSSGLQGSRLRRS